MNILLCLVKLVLTFRFPNMMRKSILQKRWSNKQSIELWIDRLLCLNEFFLQDWRSSADNFVEIQSVSESVVPPAGCVGYNIPYDIIGDSSSTTQSIMIKYLGYIIVVFTLKVYFRARPLPFSGPALSFFFFPGAFFSGARIRQFFVAPQMPIRGATTTGRN